MYGCTTSAHQTVRTDGGGSSCICDIGRTIVDNVCVQCSPGTYKATPGNVSCALCGVNTFSTATGANASSICISCGQNAVSVAGSTNCTCKAGYQPSGAACVACPLGSYKATAGNTSCIVCNANQYSGSAATSCNNCSTGSVSLAGSPFCSCDRGYTVNGTLCSACPSNTYKSSSGNSSCISCIENAVTDVVSGATNISSCVCKAGYYGNGTISCTACPVNSYKPFSGNADSCIACSKNSGINNTANIVATNWVF